MSGLKEHLSTIAGLPPLERMLSIVACVLLAVFFVSALAAAIYGLVLVVTG